MEISISEWQRHFPEGVSLATYNRIGRLIRERGTMARIKIFALCEAGLRRALDDLERKRS